jgi:hypothetical protein
MQNNLNFFFLLKNYFSDVLQTGASQFTTNASKLKRKYWWKNVKVSLLIFPSFFFL